MSPEEPASGVAACRFLAAAISAYQRPAVGACLERAWERAWVRQSAASRQGQWSTVATTSERLAAVPWGGLAAGCGVLFGGCEAALCCGLAAGRWSSAVRRAGRWRPAACVRLRLVPRDENRPRWGRVMAGFFGRSLGVDKRNAAPVLTRKYLMSDLGL